MQAAKKILTALEFAMAFCLTAIAIFFWCSLMPMIWPSGRVAAPHSFSLIWVSLVFHALAAPLVAHLLWRAHPKRTFALCGPLLLAVVAFFGAKLIVHVEESRAIFLEGRIASMFEQAQKSRESLSLQSLQERLPEMPWHRMELTMETPHGWCLRVKGRILPFWDVYYTPEMGFYYVF